MNHDPKAMMALAQAVNAVMQEVGYVKKDGNVKFGTTSYKFAGEKHIIQALRPAMVTHGLMLIPVAAESVRSERGCETVRCTYRLMHTGGAWLDVQVLGQGADKGDKAIPKALTGALKYALRQTFTIETGDDPDRDASGKTQQEIAEAEEKRRAAEAKAAHEATLNEKGHSPYFEADRTRIMKALTDNGLVYEDVAQWTATWSKYGRLSAFPEKDLRGVMGQLITEGSKARRDLQAWLSARKGAA